MEMEPWQENIINEIGYVVVNLNRGACGAWIPLFTDNLEVAKTRKLWVLKLALVIDTLDKVKGKKCQVTTISKDGNNYGVKMIFI